MKKKNNLIFERLHNSDEPLLPENLRYREHKALKYSDIEDLEDKRRFDCRPILGNEIELPIEWQDKDWPIEFVSRLDRLTELAYITGIKRISTSEFEEGKSFCNKTCEYPIPKSQSSFFDEFLLFFAGQGILESSPLFYG